MELHGRRWQIAQGKPLLNQEGQAELQVLRDNLATHTALRETYDAVESAEETT